MTLLIVGGYSLTGDTLPTRIPEVSNDKVNIVSPSVEPSRQALQLYNFSGVTPTLYPTQLPIPTDAIDEPELIDCGVPLKGTQKPQMIWGYLLNSTPASQNKESLKIFYLNQFSLLLGSGNISRMGDYYVDHVINPVFGDLAVKDVDNFPLFPAIYLTDISNKHDDISGDAEKGGQPNMPDEIYGSWQALGERMKAQNGKYLGTGADSWPPANGPGGESSTNFSAEIIWNTANLKAFDPESNNLVDLQPKHDYRGELTLHDGDNPPGIALICLKFTMPE